MPTSEYANKKIFCWLYMLFDSPSLSPLKRLWTLSTANIIKRGDLGPLYQLNPCHFLLKYLYQAKKGSGHVYVFQPLSTNVLLDFGTVPTVWHFFIFILLIATIPDRIPVRLTMFHPRIIFQLHFNKLFLILLLLCNLLTY